MSRISSFTMVAIYYLSYLAHAQDADESNGVKYLVVGNPGKGKSTFLNGFTGKHLFESGPSFGGGKTKELGRVEIEKDVFFDTPGLEDIDLRNQSAESITAALKEGGVYKVIFIVTLEAGRVMPADRTTMHLILMAAPITHYGVLINKLDEVESNMIYENKENARDHILAGLMNGLPYQTLYFGFQLRKDELAAKKNAIVPLDDELLAFIEHVPAIEINPDEVKAVNPDAFEALTEEFESKIAAMMNDKALMDKAIEEDKAKFEKSILEMNLRNKKLMEEYKKAESDGKKSGTGGLVKKLVNGVVQLVEPKLPKSIAAFVKVAASLVPDEL